MLRITPVTDRLARLVERAPLAAPRPPNAPDPEPPPLVLRAAEWLMHIGSLTVLGVTLGVAAGVIIRALT